MDASMDFSPFSMAFPPATRWILHEIHGVQAQRLRVALLREAPAELRQAAALLVISWPCRGINRDTLW